MDTAAVTARSCPAKAVLEADTQRMAGWPKFLSGLVVLLLLSSGLGVACSAAQPGAEESGRISECRFRVILSSGTGEPNDRGGSVLDAAAAIARQTGAVTITGTYSRAEYVNDFRVLEAIAMRHGGQVRDLLLSRGVAPGAIRLNGLMSHPPDPSESGAYVRVCARGRNVDNGWRERPLDPAMLVRVRIGTAILQVPMVNMGPYLWNDVPIGEAGLGEFYVDRANDPASFAEILSRCWMQYNDPSGCERLINIRLRRPMIWPGDGLPHDPRASGPPSDWQRLSDRGRTFLTRRWVENTRTIASLTCVMPSVQPAPLASLDHARGSLSCSASLRLVPDQVDAYFSFGAVGLSDAEAFMARTWRDLEHFAAARSGH